MQVHRPSRRHEPDASEMCVTEPDSQLLRKAEGDANLPHWAAAAVGDELMGSELDADKAVVRQSASDSVLSSHPPAFLPGWPSRAVPTISDVSQSMVQSYEGISDDQTSKTSLNSSKPLKPAGTRATWGPVELPVIRSQPTSVVDSQMMTENICAESLPVCSDSSESITAVDLSSVQAFSADTEADTHISLPNASLKSIEKTTSSQDGVDKPLSSTAHEICDLVDIVLEDEPGGEMSESNVNERAEQLRTSAIYQSVGRESAENEEKKYVRSVTDQHVSKETVAADERRYVKLVPEQFVGSETTQVDERVHLRTSSSATAMTISQEKPECASVKSVEGQHASVETFSENIVKPCIQLHAERHATKETDSSLLVCLAFSL